jgi:hypothetical protein
MAHYRPVKQKITETVRINVTALRRLGYFNPTYEAKGSIQYTKGGKPITRVYFETSSEAELLLNYTWGGFNITQRIAIVKKASNLKKGSLYYFVCPYTSKYVRNLYLPQGVTQFASNYTFKPPIYYESQTHSKHYKPVGQCFHVEQLLARLESARNQSQYNGQETKRSKRINALISKYNEASEKSLNDLIKKFALITNP